MTLRTICAPMMALFMLAPLVRGEQSESPPKGGGNAALQYWQAFDVMPHTDADQKTLDDWQHAKLDEATAQLIERGKVSLALLHRGAQMGACDWGLDLSQGPYMILPHLTKARSLARLACLRARYELEQKKWAEAVEDACDAMVLGRQLAQEPILFTMMFQYRIENMAVDALSPELNKLDAASMKRLVQRLDQLPADLPEADWLKLQVDLIINWMVREIKAGGATPDWSRVLGPILIGEGKPPEAAAVDSLVKAAGGTPDAIIQHLQELTPYFADAAKLVAAPLSQQEFGTKAMELRHRFDGNPLAKFILPALPGAHDIVGAQYRMTLFKAAMAVVEHGPDAVKGMMDPINHQPVTYEKRGDGFQLLSKVTYYGQPVTVTVGDSK